MSVYVFHYVSFQFLRKHHDSIFFAFAAPNGDESPVTVEVGQTQAGHFAHAQPGSVNKLEYSSVFETSGL
jgi:hypothetical protein